MEEQKRNPAQGLSESEQVQVRRQKLADLQAAGHDPFTLTKYPQDAYSADLKAEFADLPNETDSGKTDTVESHTHVGKIEPGSKQEGGNDTHHYRNHGNSRRKHTQTDTGDNDGGRSSLSAFTQFLSRAIRLGSIIFGRTSDHNADQQADYDSA